MNHSLKTRVLSMILAVVMVIGFVPMNVFATETEPESTTSETVIVKFDVNGGAGEYEDQTVVVGDKITKPEQDPTHETAMFAYWTADLEKNEEWNFEEDVVAVAENGEMTLYAAWITPTTETETQAVIPEGVEFLTVDGFVSETHDVFSRTESTIAPGVTQSINYAYAKDGKQMVYYIATADINRDDVIVQASYFNQFENEAFGMSKLTDQMAYADALFTNEEKDSFISEYYKAVVGTNGDFYNMSTGQPSGAFVINGVLSSNKANNRPWFAIFEDGTALCGANNTDWDAAVAVHGAVQQAVGGSQVLVKDGKDVTATVSGSYNTDRHSRTCVGVTADGKVVMMVLDGRQEPFSCGGSMHELAQIMLEAGCVMAINLDGGGSTTYASRPEGKNEVEVVNRPSDGSERSISSALIIASLAAPSNVFDRAVLTAENEYVTPYSTVNVTATGVSPAGTAAQIPDNAVWQLADASLGTIENGVFTSNGTVGAAVVQLTVDGVVVGQATINVVIPDITFDTVEMTVPFNKTFKLTVSGTTNSGLNEVVLKDSDLVFELSDPAMGTIDGAYYTSCDEAAGVTGGTITVKCVYDSTKTDTATVTFGKASVIAEDFEDGNIDGWSAKSAYARAGKGDLTYGRFESFDLNLVDASTGKVRNGKYALEILADFTTTTASGYKAIAYSFPAIDLTGASSFGMWMYLPVADVHNLEFDIGGYEYYIEDDANVGDEGWYYITAPAATVGSSVSTFTIYMTDPDETYFNIFNQYSIYVDDLTIDYSNATEDRENPKFSQVTVVTGLDSETAMNGQVYNENVITVKAYAAENLNGNYTGLDISTAKVYVDGVALSSSAYYCDERGVINVGNLSLADGTHSFRFEIKDKAGNTGFVTKKIVINTADGDVYLTRRSDVPQPRAGSVDYYDVIANNIEKIDSLTMTIDLDTLNKWELEGADVAYGFELAYSVDSRSNTATITITRTGAVEATGKATLVAIPVRVWSTPSYLMQKFIDAGVVSNSTSSNESTVISTPYVMWQTDRTRLVRIEMAVESATVGYTDGSTTTFASLPMNIITEHNRYRTAGYYTAEGNYVTGDITFCKQGKDSVHVHSAAVAMADQAAACTTAGYTGRTYCEECNSVIDWGTTVPATGHTYELDDGVLKCACGKTYTGIWTDGKTYVEGVVQGDGWVGDSYYVEGEKLTGVQKVTAPDSTEEFYYDFGEHGVCENHTKYTGLVFGEDGKTYFSKMGELAASWQFVDNEWYYFSHSDYAAVTGEYNYYGIVYTFDDQGKLIAGAWVESDEGFRYFYCASKYYRFTWQTIDGVTYFFDGDGYRVEGIAYFRDSTGGTKHWYEFAEDGAFIRMLDGVVEVDGVLKYFEDGILFAAGLVEVDGNVYYVRSEGIVTTGKYYVNKYSTEDLAGKYPQGYYYFDTDGTMVDTGFVTIDGAKYYVENSAITAAGFVEVDGDYYYAKSGGIIVTGKYYATNCRTEELREKFPAGYYYFGEDGKLVSTGFITLNGVKYYVENGAITAAGFVEVDGDYYYAKSGGIIVTGKYYATNCRTAELEAMFPEAYYYFDADGKLINDGLYTADGVTYYIENHAITAAGLVEYNGNYYYAKSGGIIVTGSYYITRYSDETLKERFPVGSYYFDETGAMIVNNFLTIDGVKYYVKDGKITAAGLVEVNDSLYYARSGGKVATGKYYVTRHSTEALAAAYPEGHYYFDETGAMITSGFVTENDTKYYVCNGVITAAGLVKVDGHVYYAKTGGIIVTGKYYVNKYSTEELARKYYPGYYTFDAEGRMI